MRKTWQVGDYLAHRFEELGVKDYFVVPGDYNLDLLDQLLRSPYLRMVNCCNELNAGYAADGYARTSEAGIAVVVVTYMVGSMSILNAIAGAYSEGLKVIVVCGGPESRSYAPEEYAQDFRVHHSLGLRDKEHSVRIYDQVTCASFLLKKDSRPQDVDRVLQKCCRESLPVYIEIPVDLAHGSFYEPWELRPLPGVIEMTQDVRNTIDAVSLFRDYWMVAESPVVLVGSGAPSVSVEALDRLVGHLGCAAFYLLDGKSRISEAHPQCGGLFWSIVSDPGVEKTVRESDLWITIGCRWNDLHTLKAIDLSTNRNRMLSMNENAPIHGGCIALPDGRQFGNISVNLVADLLIQANLPPNYTSCATLSQHRGRENAVKRKTFRSSFSAPNIHLPISIDDIVTELNPYIQPWDTIFADAGESWFASSRLRLPRRTDFQVQLLYSSTGWSLPAALGCQVARPNGKAIVVIGDGSFQMTGQELSTMARYRLNGIVIIVNNRGYQIEDAIHRGPYNKVGSWDYTAFADSVWQGSCLKSTGYTDGYDLFATKVKSRKDLQTALYQAYKHPRSLALLECCVDPAKASPVVKKFGSTLVRKERGN